MPMTPAPRTPDRWRSRTVLALAAAAAVLSFASSPPVVAQSGVAADGLRPLADDVGIDLGAAIDVEAIGDDGYRQLLVGQVNMLSTRSDMAMAVVQPEPGVFDFSRADSIADFAADNAMTLRGHELIGPAVPTWVATGTWTPDTLSQVLRDHVTTVVTHFRERHPGVITQWDVIGDAVLPDGSLRPTIWQQVIGDDHIRIAFEAARAADPDALLFYDDFYDDLAVTQDAVAAGVPIVPGANAERTTCDAVPKCAAVRDRLSALVAAGTPIDGIGLQSHLFSPDPFDFGEFTEWVGDLGLVWGVTEFDVPVPVTEVDDPASQAFQGEVYAAALASCVDADACSTFVTWGISDRLSPIPFETGGAFGGALWFDANDQPKPAKNAMAEVLADRAPAPTPTTVAPSSTDASDETASLDDTASMDEAADDDPDGDSSGNAAWILVAVLLGAAGLVVVAALVVQSRRAD